MQKKKPIFQAIPNYSINGVTNGNESKEVPAEQGLRGYWPAQSFRPRQAFSAGLIAIAKPSWRSRALSRIAKSSLENGAPQQCGRRNLGPDTAALFIEHSSEI
jgi:hypothetical protein